MINFPSEQELNEIIENGEDSTIEFKKELNNTNQNFSAELVAFANSKGGLLLLGIEDNKNICGISKQDLDDVKNKISNLCHEIDPPINPEFKIYSIENKKILILLIEEGYEKPYCTTKVEFWIKRGDSKRKATANELRRLFSSGSTPIEDERKTKADIKTSLNETKFRLFFEKHHLRNDNQNNLSLEQLIQNFNLGKDDKLNVAGLLLFGKQIQNYLPNALIKLVAFYGNEIEDTKYIEKIDAIGSLDEQFATSIAFLKRNLRNIASDNGFNANAKLDISISAIEEAIVNALVHRDYSYQSPITILLFKNRLEIKSPGVLPNHLTIEKIKNGNSISKNPIIVSHGKHLLPYTGIGSGIKRIIKEHKDSEFKNDKENQTFCVLFYRK